MGYETNRFISEINEEFLCSICTMVLEDPLQSPCDHLFCKECIKGWLAKVEKCPVDTGSLKLDDLKPAARFFSNLLKGLEMKCDFNIEGCAALVKLEYLANHLNICEYNTESAITCDKGCNLTISRQEHRMNNCFTHLAHRMRRLETENRKLMNEKNCLSDHVRVNEEDIKKLGQELNDQKHHFERILNQNQEEITKMSDEVNHLKEQVAILNIQRGDVSSKLKISPKWQDFVNMKIESNILEVDDVTQQACAQSLYALGRKKSFYKLRILFEGDIHVGVGHGRQNCLTCRSVYGHNRSSPGFCLSMATRVEAGDTIECGISYNAIDTVNVYVLHNERFQELSEEFGLQMPAPYGFFPKIIISGNTKVEIIKFPIF